MARKTTDALEILYNRFVKDDPEMQFELEQAHERLRLAEQLRELREREGLSREELADRAGIARSVVTRIEQSGSERHSLALIRRVAGALGYTMRVEFVPMGATVARKKKAVAKGAKAKAPVR